MTGKFKFSKSKSSVFGYLRCDKVNKRQAVESLNLLLKDARCAMDGEWDLKDQDNWDAIEQLLKEVKSFVDSVNEKSK